jgi:hypothetical protein
MDKTNNQILIEELSNLLPATEEWLHTEINKRKNSLNEKKELFINKNRSEIDVFDELINWFDKLIDRASDAHEIMQIELIMADFRHRYSIRKILISNLDIEGQEVGLNYKFQIVQKLNVLCDAISQNSKIKFSFENFSSYDSISHKKIINSLRDILLELDCDPDSVKIDIKMDTNYDIIIARQIQEELDEEEKTQLLIQQLLERDLSEFEKVLPKSNKHQYINNTIPQPSKPIINEQPINNTMTNITVPHFKKPNNRKIYKKKNKK